MSPEPPDVFISYNRDDRAWAEWIAWVLEDAGYKTVIQAWDFRPGGNFILAMQRATQARHTVAVLSPSYLAAEYTHPEWAAAFAKDPQGLKRRLIPIRVRKCEPDGLLGPLIYVDLVEETEDAAGRALIGAFAERAKPSVQPQFPGAEAVKASATKVPFPGSEEARAVPAGWPPNPFIYHMEIRDPAAFVGREAEFSRARQLLTGGSLAILGKRKVGKSSLVRRLVRSWDAGEVVGPISIDAIEGPDDFYDGLAHRLDLESGGWRAVRAALMERRALLVIDELDNAPSVGLDNAHLLRFRALCSENRKLKMITVAHQPLREIFPCPRGSFPYDFLQPLQLGEMTLDEARHLLAHPWAPTAPVFGHSTVDELLTLAGLHPFKLQRAAFHRYENLRDSSYEWRAAWRSDIEQML